MWNSRFHKQKIKKHIFYNMMINILFAKDFRDFWKHHWWIFSSMNTLFFQFQICFCLWLVVLVLIFICVNKIKILTFFSDEKLKKESNLLPSFLHENVIYIFILIQEFYHEVRIFWCNFVWWLAFYLQKFITFVENIFDEFFHQQINHFFNFMYVFIYDSLFFFWFLFV